VLLVSVGRLVARPNAPSQPRRCAELRALVGP